MKYLILTFAWTLTVVIVNAQHTFSIVAVDSVTNEVGSAGATCLPFEDGALWVSDIIPNVGGINTQAWWTSVNQKAARQRMEEGDSPQEIIEWLKANDNSSEGGSINDRQYGVVDLNDGSPRSAAFTGENNYSENGHRTGPGYAIQGNILISQAVLNDMETAFVNATGSLADRLMAAMQAAKRPGADSRCLSQNISSSSAYIRVAKPTDTNSDYGNLWLDINTWLNSGEFTGDPIDEVQRKYDEFKATVNVEDLAEATLEVFPNPTSGNLTIQSDKAMQSIRLIDMLGKTVKTLAVSSQTTMDINVANLANGLYRFVIVDINQKTTSSLVRVNN